MKKVVLSLIVIVLIVCSGCTDALKDKTAELVTVIEVKENSIVVESVAFEKQIEVEIPTGISSLIKEGNQYFIQYEHKDGKNKKLVEISPFHK